MTWIEWVDLYEKPEHEQPSRLRSPSPLPSLPFTFPFPLLFPFVLPSTSPSPLLPFPSLLSFVILSTVHLQYHARQLP